MSPFRGEGERKSCWPRHPGKREERPWSGLAGERALQRSAERVQLERLLESGPVAKSLGHSVRAVAGGEDEGQAARGQPPADGTDISALAANRIAVTPLRLDMTDEPFMTKLAELFA